jgi:hypothetical protein
MPHFVTAQVNEEIVLEPLDNRASDALTLRSDAQLWATMDDRETSMVAAINEFVCYRCRDRCRGDSAALMKPMLAGRGSSIPEECVFEEQAVVCFSCFETWSSTDIQRDNHSLGPVVMGILADVNLYLEE